MDMSVHLRAKRVSIVNVCPVILSSLIENLTGTSAKSALATIKRGGMLKGLTN